MTPDDRTQYILDSIDGALLDYRVSGDAMRWVPEPPRRPGEPGTGLRIGPGVVYDAPPPAELLAAMRGFGQAFQRAAAQMAEAFAQITEAINSALPQLEVAGLLEEQPPDDARARALWLRQHRNVGPARVAAAQQKRPRRLQ